MNKSQDPNGFAIENSYHWPADGESRPWTEFWVTTFTRSVGAAKSATILYSTDRGQSWSQKVMDRSCVLGDQDVWHVCLGTFPANTAVRYAVEAIGHKGQSVWDNCYGKDHHALIGSPKDLRVQG